MKKHIWTLTIHAGSLTNSLLTFTKTFKLKNCEIVVKHNYFKKLAFVCMAEGDTEI